MKLLLCEYFCPSLYIHTYIFAYILGVHQSAHHNHVEPEMLLTVLFWQTSINIPNSYTRVGFIAVMAYGQNIWISFIPSQT